MDLERLVRQAQAGEVRAFVEITRRFQHFAFGSALALVHDFQQAEDVVQEAFLAAWSGLSQLAEPAAFPGWLRGIVRNCCFRFLRRRQLQLLPLVEAADMPSGALPPDELLERRQEAAAALAAIAELPTALREPAILFYLHECSHQDIAVFLGLAPATVNNRLHAARSVLKQRTIEIMTEALPSHGLTDEFASRIGRLLETRGNLIEAQFDPASAPGVLAELTLSDESNRRAVPVQVVQRLAGGLVRGIASNPIDNVSRGASVLSSGRHSLAPTAGPEFARILQTIVGSAPGGAKLLETGIKVIDLMCPLVAGGTVAIAGDIGAGTTVAMEELARRLGTGQDPVYIFLLMSQPIPEFPGALAEDFSLSAELAKEGFSEGTIGPVQTFFLRAESGSWTAERLGGLAAADVVIRLSREVAKAKIYPAVDVVASRSRLLERSAVSEEHAATARRVRNALASLQAAEASSASSADFRDLERARKLMTFFGQPFFCAEPWIHRSGSYVTLAGTLRACNEILDGQHDDLPIEAFYFAGSIAEIRARIDRG